MYYFVDKTFSAISSSTHVRYILIFIILTSLACSSGDSALHKARAIDTVDVYKDFLHSYPDDRHAEWVKERIIILNDEKVFKEYELKHSIAAYKEFIERYPKNKFIERALKRINESEQEAFERTFKLGTIEDFEGFIERYPSSTYIPEIRNRIRWLKEIRIAVPHLSNSAHLKILKDTFQSSPYKVIYFDQLSETTKDNIPVVMELSSIPWHDPGKSKGKRLDAGTLYAIGAGAAAAGSVGKAAVAGGVAGGVAGAVAGGLVGGFLGEQYSVCRLIISSNNLKNKSEYASVAFDATEEKLLKGDFLGYIKKAEFIAWLSNSNEIPTGFLKTAIKYDNDYFPDDHFRQAIVNVLGAHDKRPVELILPFLNDKSHKVQLQAVESLGRTRDHRAIEGLISALKKNNTCEGPANDFNAGSHELCKMIVASLKEISGSDIHSPNQWIDWWDNNKQRNEQK